MKNTEYFNMCLKYDPRVVVGFGSPEVNKCACVLDSPDKSLNTDNIGGCVAIVTYNPSSNEASLAHLMISQTELDEYKIWFDEQELNTKGMVVALIGGSNGKISKDGTLGSSRELVSGIRDFFSAKSIAIQYEELYAEEGKEKHRAVCLKAGTLIIGCEGSDRPEFVNLDDLQYAAETKRTRESSAATLETKEARPAQDATATGETQTMRAEMARLRDQHLPTTHPAAAQPKDAVKWR